MDTKRQALLLLLVLTIFPFTIKASSSGGIAIYWGQNLGDGTLTSTCDTGNYEIVLLAFLNVFGGGRVPSWNFAGHCGDWSPCTKLEPEIKHCQQKGVKVLLSLGGAIGSYSLSSPEDAKNVADYLNAKFLSGQSGPLGSVTLDGIDFDIEGGTNLYWDDLARELDNLRQQNSYFYLSAAPQCPRPDHYLDKAIKTGLFDYVLVQFYNNPSCQYNQANGDATDLLKSWNDWTSSVLPNNTVFMGLPASPDAAGNGYIPPNDLISKVLPIIKQTSNYGGVMLWDRFHDVGNDYSNQIKKYVKRPVLRFVTKVSEAIVGSISASLNSMFPN
ncbi:putative chitinase [Medicago truncatula]|uniref:Acidic endochitinase n=1 Tax=Medicago truncatula TaxID=3880 RepID=A0A072V6R4_MEDTR|nr:hevamine-A [Medicago truncatula]KEH37512.1 chitinase [Medicago truncatula]RHN73587.1 putative chitinase [Medicago truncatula]